MPLCAHRFMGYPGCFTARGEGGVVLQPFHGKIHGVHIASHEGATRMLWIVEEEKVFVVTELYEETIKFEYNIFHNTYVPVKTEGIIAINEARGNK